MSIEADQLRIVDDVVDGPGFRSIFPGLNGPQTFLGMVRYVHGERVTIHPFVALDQVDPEELGPIAIDRHRFVRAFSIGDTPE